MNLIQKSWNAYQFTYMGDEELTIPGYKFKPGVPVIVPKDKSHLVINNIPPEEMDSFIYDKIITIN